ncbi:MAG: four helix bundle protein [Candidatus Paceibacterota bacterium]|jgi:four helix bundle protein|nr:four helix bundle protein [Candidatus Paceibacterota bacterium]
MNEGKIKLFTDLIVWREGHKLAVLIYQMTRKFPREEMYSLSDQMRRASVSVTSNIAEGFGRQGFKEKIQFYYIAHGSLTELENQLFIAKDVGYLKDADFEKIMTQANNVHALLVGFIKKSKTFL